MTKVIKDFLHQEKVVRAGSDVDLPPREHAKFAALGFVEPYSRKIESPTEVKIDKPAEVKAPGKSSPASPAAPASRKKTAKRRTKKAKPSRSTTAGD